MVTQVEIDKINKYFEIITTSFDLHISHIINSDDPESIKLLKLNDLIVLNLENLGFWVDDYRELLRDMISTIDQRITPMSIELWKKHLMDLDIIDKDMCMKNGYVLKDALIEYRKFTKQRITMKITEQFKKHDGTAYSLSQHAQVQAVANVGTEELL